jgi:hypothetical protein
MFSFSTYYYSVNSKKESHLRSRRTPLLIPSELIINVILKYELSSKKKSDSNYLNLKSQKTNFCVLGNKILRLTMSETYCVTDP